MKIAEAKTIAGVSGIVVGNHFYFDMKELSEDDCIAINEDSSLVCFNAAYPFEFTQVFRGNPSKQQLDHNYLYIETMDETGISDIEACSISNVFYNLLSEANDLGYSYIVASQVMPNRFANPKVGEIYRDEKENKTYRIEAIQDDTNLVEMKEVSTQEIITEWLGMFHLTLQTGAPVYQYIDYRS